MACWKAPKREEAPWGVGRDRQREREREKEKEKCAPGERLEVVLYLFYLPFVLWLPGDLPILPFIY